MTTSYRAFIGAVKYSNGAVARRAEALAKAGVPRPGLPHRNAISFPISLRTHGYIKHRKANIKFARGRIRGGEHFQAKGLMRRAFTLCGFNPKLSPLEICT